MGEFRFCVEVDVGTREAANWLAEDLRSKGLDACTMGDIGWFSGVSWSLESANILRLRNWEG